MSRVEWLRTFIAVYRAGSVTAGAGVRGISQPAASQQIAALSRAAGGTLLSRTRDGVGPTERGRELYGEVAELLDRLETVLAGLDGGRLSTASLPVRIAASADLFDGYVLPRIAGWSSAVTASFGHDADGLTRLSAGEADLAVTLGAPSRRAAFDTHVIGERRFLLVTAVDNAPPTGLSTAPEIADWLTGRPWVSHSHELPVTRRFWSTYLGRPFDADVGLVAPDLRSVATAVQLGVGVSLIPDYACQRPLAEGSVVEVGDASDFLSPEPIFGSLRRADTAHPDLRRLLDVLRRHPAV